MDALRRRLDRRLESPLSYVLAALFACELREVTKRGERPWRALFLASLAFVNRMDTAIVYLPAIGWLLSRAPVARRRMLVDLLIGTTPAVAWLVFSTIYFGFPLPNTYYAKVVAGVPFGDRLLRGLAYFGNSLRCDPFAWVMFTCAGSSRCRCSSARWC